MIKVLVAGSGKIGSLIACLLADSEDYEVHLVDVAFSGADASRVLDELPQIICKQLDVADQAAMGDYIKKHRIIAILSSLPYFLNITVADIAKRTGTHYFDLTEDTVVTEAIKRLAKGAQRAFVPQCGLAPGFVSIAANSLMEEFDECFQAQLRVGALPERTNNALHYSLTWSTDGLINEYGNPCNGIVNGKMTVLAPLEGLESIVIDGCEYEAFNTSGGLGSLAELYEGKVETLNYKTIRYPGHCAKMKLLMNELDLNDDRTTLKRILERALPKTDQDIVIIYVSVEGVKQGVFSEKSYVKKIHPTVIRGLRWSAIQVSTAASFCALVDMVLEKKTAYKGFVYQERFNLTDFLKNRFGQYYA